MVPKKDVETLRQLPLGLPEIQSTVASWVRKRVLELLVDSWSYASSHAKTRRTDVLASLCPLRCRQGVKCDAQLAKQRCQRQRLGAISSRRGLALKKGCFKGLQNEIIKIQYTLKNTPYLGENMFFTACFSGHCSHDRNHPSQLADLCWTLAASQLWTYRATNTEKCHGEMVIIWVARLIWVADTILPSWVLLETFCLHWFILYCFRKLIVSNKKIRMNWTVLNRNNKLIWQFHLSCQTDHCMKLVNIPPRSQGITITVCHVFWGESFNCYHRRLNDFYVII